METSEKTQSAIRRSTRLPLEIPVLVTSLDPGMRFFEQCNTTIVNAHGCGVVSPRAIVKGVQVRLEMVSAKRHTTAWVREVVSLTDDPESWLIGLELEVPGNFWGIDYAPTDWKIDDWKIEGTLSGVEPRLVQPPASALARSRRWSLTDISAGACYLETAEPLPAGSPVLLSIRAAETESLLEGIVRVSHPRTGMGVEFTEALTYDRRTLVEELIARLKSSREVPKIFVGRKEEPTQGSIGEVPGEGNNDGMGVGRLAPNPPGDAVRNDELSDALLQLIREGPSLAPEQFLNDLRAQRLGRRRDPRMDLAVPVLLTGTDVGGRPLDQRVVTVNVSRRGAKLQGIHGLLNPRDKIFLARAHHKEPFQVAWVGAEDTPGEGQIGVAAVDPNTSFWSDVLETTAPSSLDAPSEEESGTAAYEGNSD
jgi:hypothetical protein